MTLITLNAKENPNGLYNKYHKIYLSGPFGIFSVLRHPNHLRLLAFTCKNMLQEGLKHDQITVNQMCNKATTR